MKWITYRHEGRPAFPYVTEVGKQWAIENADTYEPPAYRMPYRLEDAVMREGRPPSGPTYRSRSKPNGRTDLHRVIR